jgi:uncharacterized protein (TIGR02996 family)
VTLPDADAFMRAILDAPDDDAPRLIYADALEERAGTVTCPACKGKGWRPLRTADAEYQCDRCSGSGRVPDADLSEFIRVQCAKAAIPATYQTCDCLIIGDRTAKRCQWCALRVRERALLSARGEEWEAPARAVLGPRRWANAPGRAAGGECVDYGFLRGFIGRVELPGTAWWGSECPGLRYDGWTRTCAGRSCPDCHGSGRVNAIGPAICAAAPVCEVVLSGKEPSQGISGVWLWYSTLAGDPPDYLLPEIIGFMPNDHPRTSTSRAFGSCAAALSAASTAALRWARSAAVAGKGRENVREHA